MAGRIPQEFINDLLDRVDIAEVVGARLELKRAGKEYKARCPFHEERTPSFHVVPDKGFYHCFGCGAHGTALTFLLELDRMSFVDAVESLASRAGIAVPRDRAPTAGDERRSALLELLAKADRWFQAQLRRHPERERAITYLKGRGIDGQTARRFGIGFAPPGWENLKAALGGDGAVERLIEAGLVVRPEDGDGRSWDRFRDRVMFPIRDGRGRTLAFGGRVIGDGKPKYLNSPETRVFHKGRELYGLWECRQALREPRRVVLVEGYMDVVGLAGAGVPEAVASLGTAATSEHLKKLFRLAPEVVFCFDGDAAGRRAAWKAAQTSLDVLEDGVEVRLLLLPEGEDPDSLVRVEGGEAFRARMAGATPLSEFLFAELARDFDTTTMDGRARLAHRALPQIARVPGRMLREMLLRRLAELAELPVETLEAALADAKRRVGGDGRGVGRERAMGGAMGGAMEGASEGGEQGGAGAGAEGATAARHDAPAPLDAEVAAAELDRPEGVPRAAPAPDYATAARRMRLTKEDAALALLLRHPELAARVDGPVLEAVDTLERGRVQLLVRILRRLMEEPGLSPMALLSEHLGTPAHPVLSELAERELLLDRASREAEFDEAMRGLAREQEAQRLRALSRRAREDAAGDDALLEWWEAVKRRKQGEDGS